MWSLQKVSEAVVQTPFHTSFNDHVVQVNREMGGGGAEHCLYDENIHVKGSELKTQTHLCFLLHQQTHPDAV